MSDRTDGPTPVRSDDELDQLVRDALGEVSEDRFRAMIAAAVATDQHDAGHDDDAAPVEPADATDAEPVVELRSRRSRPGGDRWNLRTGLLAAAASVAVIAGAVFVLSPNDPGDDVAGPPVADSPTTTAVAGPTQPTTGGGPCELSRETEPVTDPAPDAPTIPRREFNCSIRVPGPGGDPNVVLIDDGRLVAGLVAPEQPGTAGPGWSCIEFGEPRSADDAGTLPTGPDSTVEGGVLLDQADSQGTQAAGLEYGGATCNGSGLSVTPTGSGRFELPYRVRYCFTLDTQTASNFSVPDGASQTGGGVGCQSGAPDAEPDGLITVQVAPAT